MRKFVLILLAVLMPLQWSIAAASAHCHDGAGHLGQAQSSGGAHGMQHAGAQAQRTRTQPAEADPQRAGERDASAQHAAAHLREASTAAGPGGAGDIPRDGLPAVDLHACCHGASMPTTPSAALPSLLPAPFETPAPAPAPPSRAPEGVFRPPIPPAA